ncbi:MAG: hypothetical protein A2Z66_13840 [Chloroflexi bacterium RBG_13_66_10]|nr:MAG: hypothetical protein A2Z66_13840 [Chloroflexi bacterium RBG_13_66_10]
MSFLLQDRKSLLVAAIAFLGWALASLGYLFEPLGPGTRGLVSNIATVLAAWSVVALAFLLGRSYDRKETAWRIWMAMFLGFFLWGIGEILWAYYDLLPGGEVPFPSLADLLWAVGYLPLWVALWLRFRSIEVRPGLPQGVALAAVVLVGIVAVRYVLWPVITYTEFDRPIEQFLDLLYPIGDLAILMGSVLVAVTVRGGRLSVPWQVISVGMVVLALADLIFAYGTWNELYVTEGSLNLPTILVDLPYMGAYAVVAVGEYIQGRLDGVL